MLSGKSKIRLTLIGIALISLGTSFLILIYMNRMVKKLDQVAFTDAKIIELGETISIDILDARREEKNFIIYSDSVYIDRTRKIIEEIQTLVDHARTITSLYAQQLDSIDTYLDRYSQNIETLIKTFQEDPRTLNRLQQQVFNYQEELRQLVQERRLSMEDLPELTSDINVLLLGVSTNLSADKVRLFSELKENADHILALAQEMTTGAKETLSENSEAGIQYGVIAQRNTLMILLITIIILVYMIIYLPLKIFLPYKRISKALEAISRGESEFSLPNLKAKDEVGDLSRSFEKAIHQLQLFNKLKTVKINEIQRNFHRVLEEINEGVIILSPEHQILYLNDKAKNIFSLRENIIGKFIKTVSPLWQPLADLLEHIDEKGKSETSLKLNKMQIRKKTISMMPITGSTGKLDSILIVVK
ncbi:HAMP domain-containing protein [bacterium]|nr:HAMP domain-containing protein [bacterium]RQV96324.1 MAG: HAMP domain-containing protein [bacterium]